MPNTNTPDVGWLFGELYICNSEQQLQKIAEIGQQCRNAKQKTFYHEFLLQKYNKIKDNPNFEREPFANFEKDIGPYAYRAYVRSSANKEMHQDPTLMRFMNALAKDQYHSS